MESRVYLDEFHCLKVNFFVIYKGLQKKPMFFPISYCKNKKVRLSFDKFIQNEVIDNGQCFKMA